MKNYTKSTVRDLGSVADLTQAFVNGPGVDDGRFDVPLPGGVGSVVINGTMSGAGAIDSPFPVSDR